MQPNTAAPTPLSGVLSEYLTRDQLAQELGVTVRTLNRWRWERKAPPAHRIAGRVLFKRQDVANWIEAQREQAE